MAPRKTMKRKAKSGNRKTHFSKWTDFVKKVYREMKQRNPNAMLRDAMMEASKRKREM